MSFYRLPAILVLHYPPIKEIMPIVQAYKASLTVNGHPNAGSTDLDQEHAPFYTKTLTVYGETPGEVVDNLVKASVEMANAVFEWLMLNKPADYRLKDEYWSVQNIHPNFLETDLSDIGKDTDSGSGGSISEVIDIVRHTVMFRDIDISFSQSHLSLAKSGESNIPTKPAVSYRDSYEVESFQELTNYGWSGKEFDEILTIAKEEGRLQAYRASRAAGYRAHERRRQERVAEAKREERAGKGGFLSKILGL